MTLEEKINRNEFLKKMGFAGSSLFALYTLDSCKTADVLPSGGITLDLSAASNAPLKTNGGYVITSGVVVANHNGKYIAATVTCSHEDLKQVIFKNGEWFCTAHDARFSTTGAGLNKEASKGLKVYATSLSGTTLSVTN
jgi:nitrite reductase/ring-hydroxylating ferredoxin subunit